MSTSPHHNDARVAVLVDCENSQPDILDYALKMAAQFGRVVLRRGYGNHTALIGKNWQDALIHQAFTPCLQYQYVSGKNTADIALALDALEAMFDHRADKFCLVSSDSDFAYLCRKLKERGATVYVVGEQKTPKALRNASDQFFEWTPVQEMKEECSAEKPAKDAPEPVKPAAVIKRRPRFVIDAVALLANSTADGQVTLSSLGSYLKRMDPGFSPNQYGHSGLLHMLQTYDLLKLKKAESGHYSVGVVEERGE